VPTACTASAKPAPVAATAAHAVAAALAVALVAAMVVAVVGDAADQRAYVELGELSEGFNRATSTDSARTVWYFPSRIGPACKEQLYFPTAAFTSAPSSITLIA
jgi:hypothetical protein